ncbi:hypothetical protein PIB30_001746 [Stylosanthes scabra]|uniref:Uncharacterized protein n=1 Tax=Stylosanthes scabra TaxID=79078 RepID=A0ABU6V342_9FABA|nr:hypothetical protein [Stylosanthes scabra]
MASSQQEEEKIPLKVFIDKQHNKVVAVESTKDFVDTLFSFLSLPLSTIIRLLTKQQHQHQQPLSILGSITNLYQSVQNLNQNHFFNAVCKHMLLCPRNPCDSLCWKLFFNIDDTEPTPRFLVCEYCTTKFTTFRDLICSCGCGKPVNRKPYDLDWELGKKNNGDVNEDDDDAKCGVFVKENGSLFLVFDDLTVVPSSLVTSLQMLHQLGYSDLNQLDEVTRSIGKEEILNLLKYSITSYEPLTNTILASDSKEKDKQLNPFASAIRVLRPSTNESKMDVKIVLRVWRPWILHGVQIHVLCCSILVWHRNMVVRISPSIFLRGNFLLIIMEKGRGSRILSIVVEKEKLPDPTEWFPNQILASSM